MLTKLLPANFSTLKTPQLLQMQDAIEKFIFTESHLFMKGEPYAPTLKKDKKHFDSLLSIMISFKRDLMGYFKKQYQNRYNLLAQGLIRTAEGDLDNTDDSEDDGYFYMDQWDLDNNDLSGIIENQTSKSYNLGVLGLLLGAGTDHSATSENAQKYLLNNALAMAIFINTTTRRRLAVQIKASIALNETRTEFDKRIQKVFDSAYRGRFIAQHEALKTYMEGKSNAAEGAGMAKKRWIGPQAIDEICGSVDGKTVLLNETFTNGFDQPPAHYGCRCDVEFF